MKSRLLICLLMVLLPLTALGQEGLPAIPVQTWRTHFSYNNAQLVATNGQVLFCAAPNGFFIYDPASNTTTIRSKANGLSGTGVQIMAWNNPFLLLGYANGQLDVLNANGQIQAIDLANQIATPTPYTLNQAIFVEGSAWIASSIGILQVNPATGLLEEAFSNLGASGQALAVNSLTAFADTLYAATPQGMLLAPLNQGLNLLDFANWLRPNNTQGLPTQAYTQVAQSQGIVYAAGANGLLYQKTDLQWQVVSGLSSSTPFISATAGSNGLLLSNGQSLFEIRPNQAPTLLGIGALQAPQQALNQSNGDLWVADAALGLVQISAGGATQNIVANGPATDAPWRLYNGQEQIFTLPGGHDNAFAGLDNAPQLSVFNLGLWANELLPLANVTDITAMVSNVATENGLPVHYLAAYNSGLIRWVQGQEATLVPVPATLLSSTLRITDLAADQLGNIWVAAYGNNSPLLRLDANGQWQAFDLGNSLARQVVQLAVTPVGDVWLRPAASAAAGLFAFNAEQGLTRWLRSEISQGGLRSNRVTALTLDLQGQIWVGTDEGVVYFPDPFSALRNPTADAFLPFFENALLLRDEQINAIVVDGGNRKWMATEKGVWLFEEDGESLVFRFTAEDSPLPGNLVSSIAVAGQSGEVFFSTNRGIASFRSTATTGSNTQPEAIQVFPNPFSLTTHQTLTISGLVNNAIVKITDASGMLVRQLEANGGTAVWDGLRFNGARPVPGVYLVFVANATGNESLAAKFAITP